MDFYAVLGRAFIQLLVGTFVLSAAYDGALELAFPSRVLPYAFGNSANSDVVSFSVVPTYQTVFTEEAVRVVWLNSTTTSIGLYWSLADRWPESSLEGWKLVCHLERGTFVSRMQPVGQPEFELTDLRSNTAYNVCVTLYEKVPTETIRGCAILSTIPLIRQDSLLILLLSLGYYVLMVGIGYCQWKRRSYLRKKWKRTDTGDRNSSQVTSVRWKDLEESDDERFCLNSNYDTSV